MLMWMMRLIGLGVAVSLLAGVGGCSDERASDVEAARDLAEQGHADAQALLAEAYYFGHGCGAGLRGSCPLGPSRR